jgi:hypothetical protein
MQEQIGHLAKGIDALFGRAVFHGVFKFGDDGMIELLQDTPHYPLRPGFSVEPGYREAREGVGKSNEDYGRGAPIPALK